MSSRLIHVVACVRTAFVRAVELSVYNGHLHCFHLLATVNNDAVNMGMQISLRDPTFNFFESIPSKLVFNIF